MAGLYFSIFAERYYEKIDKIMQKIYWWVFELFGFDENSLSVLQSKRLEDQELLGKVRDSGTGVDDW